MKEKTVTVIVLGVFALFLMVSVGLYSVLTKDTEPEAVVQTEATEEAGGEEAGEKTADTVPAIDFTAVNNAGESVKLSSYYGKPIVLNFWATWCPNCTASMPVYEKLYKEYGDKVNFVMVNATDGYQETREVAAKYIEKKGYTFPVLYDTKYEATTAYEVSGIPVTYFINSDGEVVTGAIGGLDEATARKGMDMIMN